MENFKVGDIVICIPGFNYDTGGALYEEGLIFKITNVNPNERGGVSLYVLWSNGKGVWSDAVRFTNFYEEEQYNKGIKNLKDIQKLEMFPVY